MTRPDGGLTRALYALVASLPRFDHGFHPADLPGNGLYLFFERGETVAVGSARVERIVRVGTHGADCPRSLIDGSLGTEGKNLGATQSG